MKKQKPWVYFQKRSLYKIEHIQKSTQDGKWTLNNVMENGQKT